MELQSSNTKRLDISGLAPGIYYLRGNKKKQRFSGKFLKI